MFPSVSWVREPIVNYISNRICLVFGFFLRLFLSLRLPVLSDCVISSPVQYLSETSPSSQVLHLDCNV